MKTVVRYFTICLFFLVLGQHGFAQDFINEDFLDHIEDNAKPLWDDHPQDFNNAVTNEAFKKESAVILGFRRFVNIDKTSRSGFLTKKENSLVFFENTRFKVLLNDRSAVSNFTEIYFRYNDKADGFSARVTKSDGKVQNVSLKEAVSVESLSNVPEFFQSFLDKEEGADRHYYKVAIPNLEPGDVFEYVAVTKSKLNVNYTGYIEFSPQYEVCSKNYPVLFNQIAVETDDKSYFKSLSINGAPKFEKEAASDPGFYRYVFTDRNRAIEKDVHFVSSYRVYPMVKFQVIYSNSDKTKGALIGEKGEIKSGFSKEELARKAWEDYVSVGGMSISQYTTVQMVINGMWAELKRQGATTMPDKNFINTAYYRLRNFVLGRDSYLSDKVAAYIFGSLLYQKNIKSDLIISISNSIGKLDQVLFDQEIRYIVRVNDQYYFNCTDFSNPADMVQDLMASDAYIIKEPTKSGTQEITPIVLPNTTAVDNQARYSLEVSLLPDMSNLGVVRNNTYMGISKTRNIRDALKYTPYMLDDYRNFGGSSPAETLTSTQADDYYRSVKALKDEFKELKPEFVKSQLEDEFGHKVTYKDFLITSDGRNVKRADLVYKETFEIGGMVKKAGKKYLVNLPGLIGSQLQIKEEERTRKYDINVGYARSLQWEINFAVPAGYKVEGLKEMNMSIDNEVGTYTCTAEEAAGKVVLKITKVYKKADIPKEKWNDMLAVLDAAYNSQFKYLLLRPVQ